MPARHKFFLAATVFLFFGFLFIFVSLCSAVQPGEIIITEIMQNPAKVDDSKGEWFEIYNASSQEIDINGWVIRDDGKDSHPIDNGGSLIVLPEEHLVLCRNSNTEINGGVICDYQYSGFILGNDDDEIILLIGELEVDRVEYDGGPNFPDPTGASMELKSLSLDNNVGSNWQVSFESFGDGDLGTPGRPNSIPPTPTPTSSPTPTTTPKPTSTPKPTATPKPAATSTPTLTPTAIPSPSSPTMAVDRELEGALGEELVTESSFGSIAGEVTQSGELISPTATPSSKFRKVLGGIFLSLGGLAILGAGAFLLIRKKYFGKTTAS